MGGLVPRRAEESTEEVGSASDAAGDVLVYMQRKRKARAGVPPLPRVHLRPGAFFPCSEELGDAPMHTFITNPDPSTTLEYSTLNHLFHAGA